MLNFRRILLFVFTMVVVFFTFTLNINNANAIGKEELKSHLEENYRGFFMEGGVFQTRYSGIPLNLGSFQNDRDVFYGNSGSVTGNNKIRGVAVASGYTFYDDWYPNRYTPYTFCTTGNIKFRNYYSHPYNQKSKLGGHIYFPNADDYNNVLKLQDYFKRSGKILSISQVQEIKNKWLRKLNDQYGEDDPSDKTQQYYKNIKRGCFTRSTKGNNHFEEMSIARLNEVIHIVQPPTEYTNGLAVIFHINSVGSTMYDQHYIDPLIDEDDFEATNLRLDETSPGVFDIYFSVKNKSGKELDTGWDLQTYISVSLNGQFLGDYAVSGHGIEWSEGQEKEGYFGQIILPVSEGDVLKVVAEFNHGDAQPERYEERTYNNNRLEITNIPEVAPTCLVSGGSESATYYNLVCAEWGTNSEGKSVCTKRVCSGNSISLNHSAKADYDSSRQTLLGVWSRNTKGHIGMTNVPKAYDAVLEYGNENYKVELDIAVLKEMGVNPVRRVIRSGRSLQLYSVLELELTAMEFEFSDAPRSDADIKAALDVRKDSFINHLLDTLKVQGVNFGSEKVLNQIGERGKGKYDSARDNPNAAKPYSEKIIKPLTHNSYGSKTCAARADGGPTVKRHQQTYSFIIPMMSENELMDGITSQGNFANDINYKVKNGLAEFYTNVNTMNGLHGLQFESDMDGSKIGPGVSQMFCESKPEIFGVQGNMFDDVRSEEVDNEHDGDWDW